MQKNFGVKKAEDSEFKNIKSYININEGMGVEKWVKIKVAYKMEITKVEIDLI